MSLGIWMREDVQRVLLAADIGCQATLATANELGLNSDQLRAYRRGYEAALVVVAAGFGIEIVPRRVPARTIHIEH